MPRFNNVATPEAKATAELKADAVLANLRTKTPAQAAQYVEDNVTDLASAKKFLKVLAKIIVVLAKQLD